MLLALFASALCLASAFVAPSPASVPLRAAQPSMGILKGISPLLSPELLYVLRSAGHRDVIAIVDANFPAVSNAVKTTHQKVVSMAGATLPETLEAIATHLPIDAIDEEGVVVMLPPEDLELPPLGQEVQADGMAALEATCGAECATVTQIRREEFYERARNAFAIVQSGERRPYGNFLLTVGMLGPDGRDF